MLGQKNIGCRPELQIVFGVPAEWVMPDMKMNSLFGLGCNPKKSQNVFIAGNTVKFAAQKLGLHCDFE